MRETLSLRGAPVRALLGFIAISTIALCIQKEARADDTIAVTTIAAPSPRTFGEKGDVIFPLASVSLAQFAGALGTIGAYSVGPVSFSYWSNSDGLSGRDNTTEFVLNPTFDVFVARHFSVGGTVLVSYVNEQHVLGANEDPTQTSPAGGSGAWSLGLLPRIGYAIPLGEHVALWPRLAGGIIGAENFGENNPGPPQTPVAFEAIIDAPIIYRIDRRFFASITPKVTIEGAPQMTSSGQSFFETSFGSDVLLGFVL